MIRYQVIYRYFHENSVGEQGNGPRLEGKTFDTREEAAEEARRIEGLDQYTGGAGLWTRANVIEVRTEGEIDG